MARRRQFRGICRDLVATFTSRNNDLNGYWALGLFRSLLDEAGLSELSIDLADGTTIPPWSEVGTTAKYYRELLLHLMEASQLPRNWLAKGTMQVKTDWLNKMVCKVEVTSDLGKTYSFSSTEYVRPHDLYRKGRRRIYDYGPSTISSRRQRELPVSP